MIYIIKQEGLYQYKVSSSLVSTCNCKMGYSEGKSAANAANLGKDVGCEIVAILTPLTREGREARTKWPDAPKPCTSCISTPSQIFPDHSR